MIQLSKGGYGTYIHNLTVYACRLSCYQAVTVTVLVPGLLFTYDYEKTTTTPSSAPPPTPDTEKA